MIGSLLHNLLHRHLEAHKPCVGVIAICSNRFTGKVSGRYFAAAEGDEPVWVPVPADRFDALASAPSLTAAYAALAGAS